MKIFLTLILILVPTFPVLSNEIDNKGLICDYYSDNKKQITELLDNNNALKMPLNECIEWFNRIPSCWNKSNFEDGRLVVCDNACGN